MTSPNNQLIIDKIKSGELFTPEYQERERQRKAAVMRERIERQKKANDFYRKQMESRKTETVNADFNPYAGKKSGDYVGD